MDNEEGGRVVLKPQQHTGRSGPALRVLLESSAVRGPDSPQSVTARQSAHASTTAPTSGLSPSSLYPADVYAGAAAPRSATRNHTTAAARLALRRSPEHDARGPDVAY